MKRKKGKTTGVLLILQGKMTLRQFAERVGIGQSTLHNYLKGRRLPEEAIILICDAFNISADYLLGRCADKEIKPSETNLPLLSCIMEIKGTIGDLKDLVKRHDTKETGTS